MLRGRSAGGSTDSIPGAAIGPERAVGRFFAELRRAARAA